MAIERFTRVHPQDNKGIDAPSRREFVELCLRLERVLERIIKCPLLDGVLIQDVSLDGTNSTSITHGLGRKWVGWIVVSKSVADNSIGEGTQTDTSKYLVLTASAAQTIDVWVF